jgi:hypothetical protein
METLAPPTTAPVGSVTVPTILPVLIVVWAVSETDIVNTQATIRASATNRTPERGELSFNIGSLPFSIVLIEILHNNQK